IEKIKNILKYRSDSLIWQKEGGGIDKFTTDHTLKWKHTVLSACDFNFQILDDKSGVLELHMATTTKNNNNNVNTTNNYNTNTISSLPIVVDHKFFTAQNF